ncbi:unnamed protein product [Symbiodinium natans]|uniref:Uncharacterized protein n=1 Tax=Symbiodinium natans TaxID=878477 RepID=A0A812HWL5_9DINO|nr:unnamed protein product [Symbiodinium natans]
MQSSLDPQGHIRITRTKQKLEMPVNSEAYRRVMRVEMFAWLAMASRFKAKDWLQGLESTHFLKFTDYVLGERVAGLRLPSLPGADSPGTQFRPPWHSVLSYEFRLRKEAFRLVNEERVTLATALERVVRDTELKELCFTTPLALSLADGSPTKFRKGNGKGKHETPKGGKPSLKGSEVLKTPGMFAGFTLISTTPDGRQICYAFNSARGCKGKCGRVHICRVQGCGKAHGVHQHKAPAKTLPEGVPTPPE